MVRLTKPSPDHPRDEGPTDMLKRHFALVKALALVMVGGSIIWVLFTGWLMIGAEWLLGWNLDEQVTLVPIFLLIGLYIVRLIMLYFLPVEY